MSRYIDADALGIGRANRDVFDNKAYADGWNSAIDIIVSAPTADVQEVKHGKWIVCGMFDDLVKCSCCGYRDTRNHVIYENLMCCGKCGAIMDEEEQQ